MEREVEKDAMREAAEQRMAGEPSTRALNRAESLALGEGNETLARNLRWYRERLLRRSYAAIACEEGKVPATIRTGVARARKFVLRVAHDLEYAQPAPLCGEAPQAIEPLRRLWLEQDLEALAKGLERTRAEQQQNPHWLNLAGLLAADGGHASEAMQHYERALIGADAPDVRARVLNNLGNLVERHGLPDEARAYWLRARSLLPQAPAPLLNLLAAASHARDYTSAQHYLAELAELMRSGRLADAERHYVERRLRENPRLSWLRETDVWAHGPARWLRGAQRRVRSTATSALRALLVAAALLAAAPARPGLASQADAAQTVAAPDAARNGGGDSMGGPAKG